MTKTRPSKEERERKTAMIFQYHKRTFELLGIENPLFYPKPVFTWKNNQQCISLYERELTSEKGFFTEITDENYNPFPERKLYMWKGNEHSKEEFYKNSTGVGERWFIPVDELQEIKSPTPSVKEEVIIPQEEMDEEDSLIGKLTIKDLAAILLREPVSEKQWLNKIISNANRKYSTAH